MAQRIWFIAWVATIAGGFFCGWYDGQKDEAKPADSSSVVTADQTRNAPDTRETRLVEEVLREKNAATRRQVLTDFAAAEGEQAIVGAIGILQKSTKSPRQAEALDELFHAWGKVAPLNALKALGAEPQRTQWRWQKQILTGWADVDSAAAWNWLQQNVPLEGPGTLFLQSFRYEQYSAVIDHLLKNDRSHEVEALLASTPSARVQQTVAASLVRYFASYDLAGGIAWLNEQPQGVARANAVATITNSIAAQAPDIAIPFAMGFAKMGDRSRALRTAFEMAGKAEDYSAATRWIMNQKVTFHPETDAALTGFVPEIALRDPELAIRLINERSDLGSRDLLTQMAVAKVRTVSLDNALSIIVGVPVNSQRAEQLTTVVKLWATKDSVAARAAIDRQPALTSAERESLLSMLPAK